MSKLLVYTYKTEDKAAQGLQAITEMKQENIQKPLISIEDAAVVIKNAKGKVKVRQTLESAVKSVKIASGGFWGLLIGFIFGGPLFGYLLGMGLSALFGRKIDLGISNSFIKDVSDGLYPGNSALFLLVNDDTPVETISSALEQFGGNLYYTNFSKEAQEVIAQASEQESLAEALEVEQND